MLPGAGNYLADCNSSTRPTNETSIASNGSVYVAGANDYNSYNGNADLGFYWSMDAKTWHDNGPLDLFAQGTNHAAGDPGLAIDGANVAYYSSIYFDYFDCVIGGVELSRRDPATGAWANTEIKTNTSNAFQDKPAIAQDEAHVFVSWDEYLGCFGSSGMSKTRVAVFDGGPVPTPVVAMLTVPGTTNSAGSALAPDGSGGGFFLALEDFAPAGSSIKLYHYGLETGWSDPQVISPPTFTDLPSPLPGFAFRDNSFPMLTVVGGQPKVVWSSHDTGVGRTYLWSNGSVSMVSNSGGDQFFPSIAASSTGQLAISWSQTNQANQTYDQYLSVGGGAASKISNYPSKPNQDCIFAGTFIGDYNSTVVVGETAHPIWTQVTRPATACVGKAQDALVYAP
ncbi:MAG TPA: hypothetical protein VEM93_06625 [Actinomycetota bacterium]|nr:hypothetical protein [Actinomycetota bacterium]